MNYDKESLIYFAGILDGEGSIMIELQSANNVRKYDYFSLRLVVTNTNLDLINWLKENFSGKISQRHKIVGRKITYDWKLYTKTAAELIKQALPWIIVKKEKALVFIEFAETIGKTGWNLSQEIKTNRKLLYDKLRILNKQGE